MTIMFECMTKNHRALCANTHFSYAPEAIYLIDGEQNWHRLRALPNRLNSAFQASLIAVNDQGACVLEHYWLTGNCTIETK